MFHVVRWATVHPALAHFTIGGLPLLVLAYALAWRRRSPAWTRTGDAALALTAAITVGTGAFGLVSNAIVPWPGGIEGWRLLHLAGGMATTLALAVFAAVRLGWRREPGRATLAAALGVAALAGFTGWIGGEVLVFHAGMAVHAAGDGALAPPVYDTRARPRDFLDAMRQARAAWAGVQTRLAWMLVHEPRDEEFDRVIVDAKRLHEVAGVMADEGAKAPRGADQLASMSQTLAGDADDMIEAARKRSLQELAAAVGEASGHCADCHSELRWRLGQNRD